MAVVTKLDTLPQDILSSVGNLLPTRDLIRFCRVSRNIFFRLTCSSGVSSLSSFPCFRPKRKYQVTKFLQRFENLRVLHSDEINTLPLLINCLPKSITSLHLQIDTEQGSNQNRAIDFKSALPNLKILALVDSSESLTTIQLSLLPSSLTHFELVHYSLRDDIYDVLPENIQILKLKCCNSFQKLDKLPASITSFAVSLYCAENDSFPSIPPLFFHKTSLEHLDIEYYETLHGIENLPPSLKTLHVSSSINFSPTLITKLPKLTSLSVMESNWDLDVGLPASLTFLRTDFIMSHKQYPSSITHLQYRGRWTEECFGVMPDNLQSLDLDLADGMFPAEKLKHLPRSLTYLHIAVDKDFAAYMNDLPSNLAHLKVGFNYETDFTYQNYLNLPSSIRTFLTGGIKVPTDSAVFVLNLMEKHGILDFLPDDKDWQEKMNSILDVSKILIDPFFFLEITPEWAPLFPRNLTTLSICNAFDWKNEDLPKLPQTLTFLSIQDCDNFDHKSLELLPSSIEFVHFTESTRFTLELYDYVPPSLKELKVKGFRITDKIGDWLGPNVEKLNSEYLHVLAKSIVKEQNALGNFKFEIMDDGFMQIMLTDGFAEYFARAPNIVDISFEGDTFTDNFLRYLPGRLKRLRLTRNNLITEAGITFLCTSKTLTFIDLPQNKLINWSRIASLPPNISYYSLDPPNNRLSGNSSRSSSQFISSLCFIICTTITIILAYFAMKYWH